MKQKMVTYPRTDSQYVTEDMKETVEMLMNGMIEFLPLFKIRTDWWQSGASD